MNVVPRHWANFTRYTHVDRTTDRVPSLSPLDLYDTFVSKVFIYLQI